MKQEVEDDEMIGGDEDEENFKKDQVEKRTLLSSASLEQCISFRSPFLPTPHFFFVCRMGRRAEGVS